MFYSFPTQAQFGRALPKNKIYEHAGASNSLKQKFVQQVDKIVWQYKLASETINLPAAGEVAEIQVFDVQLKEGIIECDEALLRAIDKAIRYPIYFRLFRQQQVKCAMAFKRAHEGYGQKWVVGDYFSSTWADANAAVKPLPMVLNLASLYEHLLQGLIQSPARKGETLAAQVERLAQAKDLQVQMAALEAQLRTAKQFNRKVETNGELRRLKEELSMLTSL